MTTPTKSLAVCTTASLAALTASAATFGVPPWMWITWAFLAAVTVTVVALDTRQRASRNTEGPLSA